MFKLCFHVEIVEKNVHFTGNCEFESGSTVKVKPNSFRFNHQNGVHRSVPVNTIFTVSVLSRNTRICVRKK